MFIVRKWYDASSYSDMPGPTGQVCVAARVEGDFPSAGNCRSSPFNLLRPSVTWCRESRVVVPLSNQQTPKSESSDPKPGHIQEPLKKASDHGGQPAVSLSTGVNVNVNVVDRSTLLRSRGSSRANATKTFGPPRNRRFDTERLRRPP